MTVQADPAGVTPAGRRGVVGLPPRIHPLVRELLAGGEDVASLVARWGSPLNLVLPEIFRENVARLRDILRGAGLDHRIHFAHKANQSASFVRAALDEGIGIDVASAGELDHARRWGFPPDRIEVTGPKGRDFLGSLVEAGVTVNVDNLWELGEVIRLAGARGPGPPVPVLVRLCGFGGEEGRDRLSRFGIPVARFEAVVDLLVAGAGVVDFRGLAFHLDSSETRDKVRAVDDCLRLFERCVAAGLVPRVLNIGGGLRQAFVERAEEFDDYLQELKQGLIGRGDPLSWDGNTFGLRYEDGAMRGIPIFHKYANSTAGGQLLVELLESPLPGHGGRTIARLLQDNLVQVWLEPGKALVDQAGVTVGSVEFVKEAADGSLLVNVDLSRDKICPADQEVMLDPVVLHRSPAPATAAGAPVGVFFAGNLCLERDMVFNHLTYLDRLPDPGDLVVFVNTAAYHMDLSASDALMQRKPAKVEVVAGGGGVVSRPDTGVTHPEVPR